MKESEINNILKVIEDNIFEDLNLLDYEKMTGYSRYYLTRTFKKQTGFGLMEYVSLRRLACAASYLINTEEALINIAMSLHFQSQEAFTRKFKESYNMPPGKYRKVMRQLNYNKEMNEVKKGWYLSSTNSNLYEMNRETVMFHSGKQCAILESTDIENQLTDSDFGTILQSISSKNYLGRRIKFSAFVKTEDAHKVGVWARIDDKNDDCIAFDNMSTRPITGTNDWSHHSVVLEVSENANSIHFGILLIGQGKVWIDKFKLEEVDNSIETTNMMLDKEELPKEPIDLEFELI